MGKYLGSKYERSISHLWSSTLTLILSFEFYQLVSAGVSPWGIDLLDKDFASFGGDMDTANPLLPKKHELIELWIYSFEFIAAVSH